MATDSSPAWTVVSQQEIIETGPSGALVSGVKVTFRTRDNATGSVFIPDTEYNATTAKARIDERAAAMLAVSGLTG